MTFLKNLFQDTCPHCNQPMTLEDNPLYYKKVCPNGHYKEETYAHLGVRIIIKD